MNVSFYKMHGICGFVRLEVEKKKKTKQKNQRRRKQNESMSKRGRKCSLQALQVDTVEVEGPVPEEEPPAPWLFPPFLRRPASTPESSKADEAVDTLPPPAALAPLPAAPLPRPPRPEVDPPVATLPPLPAAPEALEGTTETVAAAPARGERNLLAAAPAEEALEPGFLEPAPAAVVVTEDAPCEVPAAPAAPGATLLNMLESERKRRRRRRRRRGVRVFFVDFSLRA